MAASRDIAAGHSLTVDNRERSACAEVLPNASFFYAQRGPPKAMASVNKVILIGNLGRDPEVRTTPSGQTVASFSVATSESFNDRSGARQERTDWHNITVWGKQAEICSQYLKKGRSVYIEGRISYSQYEAKDGTGKRYRTEIVAQRVQFLGGRGGAGGGDMMDGPPDMGGGGGMPPGPEDEDIPF
jgi:single-strand DNA-binding protein